MTWCNHFSICSNSVVGKAAASSCAWHWIRHCN